MAIRIVRLGSKRSRGEGVRIGTVRRPPRGVKKSDHARLDFYDVWLPELSPSAELFGWAMSQALTDQDWTKFERRYRREMSQPDAQRLIALFAALSKQTNLSMGCYCEDERRCHRSILRALLVEAGASVLR